MEKLTIEHKLRTLDVFGIDNDNEVEICLSHGVHLNAYSIWLTKTEAKKLIKFLQTQINQQRKQHQARLSKSEKSL